MSDVVLTEAIFGQNCKVDREAGLIRGVKLLGLAAPTKNRRYAGQAAKKAVPLYEGARVYLNHPKKTETSEPRSFGDRFGTIVNPEYREGDGNYGDLKYIPDHPMAKAILWLAENDPKSFGMSHRAQGKSRMENGTQVIEEITSVVSVDLVSDPATTNGLFESKESEDETMDLSKLTIEEIKSGRPDLVESLSKAILAESKGAAELEQLKQTNKLLQEQIDQFKAKENIAAKQTKIKNLCETAKLPKEAITEVFVSQLMEAKDDAAITALIEDRKAIFGGGGKPKSTEQGAGGGTAMSAKDFMRELKR